MNLVQRRRLLRLACFLGALPPKKFSFKTWVGEDWKGKPDLSCGTTACALGWACAMPEFRKLGAGIQFKKEVLIDFTLVVDARLTWKGEPDEELVSKKLFGLTWEEHRQLFVPYEYGFECSSLDETASAKEVAAHIRKFLKKHPAKKPRKRDQEATQPQRRGR